MIWLVSYPKSGNTWLRLLFVLAMHDERLSLDRAFRQLRQYSPWEADRKWFEPLLDRSWSNAGFRDLLEIRNRAQALMRQSHGPRAIVKSHNMATSVDGIPLFSPRDDGLVVQLIRNPLDVTVSVMHHVGCSEERAADLVTMDRQIIVAPRFCAWEMCGSWRSHTESWLNHPPYPAMQLRFEALVAGGAAALARAFEFGGLDVSSSAAGRLLEKTAIPRLQQLERTVGFNENPSVLGLFFRQGRVGAWKDCLSADTRKKVISHCRPLMDELDLEH